MLVTVTAYSRVAPGSAGPPSTTTTSLAIASCWASPTTTTVGSGPVAGLPSPSVSRSTRPSLATTAWLLINVPGGTPASTCRSNCTTADSPGDKVPSPAAGSGGVRSAELIATPAASGNTPPSGCPTGSPFSVSVSAT